MREEKFYCDRCGKEMGLPLSIFYFNSEWVGHKRRSATIAYMSVLQRERIIAESNNNITESYDPIRMSEIYKEPVAIETEYRSKRKTSDLCHKCYLEFLQFMKGEKKDEPTDR